MSRSLDTTLARLRRGQAAVKAAESLARALRPVVRTRPSEWASKHLILPSEITQGPPRPWDPNRLPWTRAVTDCLHEHPEKIGFIAPKPAQATVTVSMLAMIAAHAAQDGGSVLTTYAREESSRGAATKKWQPLINASPLLRERFAAKSAKEAKAEGQTGEDKRPRTVLEYPMNGGGSVVFALAGSAAALSSETFPVIIGDEYDQCEANFPAAFGSLFEFVQGRQARCRASARQAFFSHPTREDVGIWRLWRDYSDRGCWCFTCPHGDHPCRLDMACLHFDEYTDDGAPVPESHEVRCPTCGGPVSDSDRRARVWERGSPRDVTGLGSGRFEPGLDAREAAAKEYLGLAIHALMDPETSSLKLAQMEARTHNKPEDRQAFRNVTCGEAFTPAATTFVVPDLVKLIRAGHDDEHCPPADHPVRVPSGPPAHAYVTYLRKVQGLPAMLATVAALRAEIDGGEGGVGLGQSLTPAAAFVDDGWGMNAGDVKDACRATLYPHAASGGPRIELCPVKFAPGGNLNNELTWKLRDEQKRLHPTRRDLGPIDMYDLYRHAWVDRVLRMLQEGRLVFLTVPPRSRTPHGEVTGTAELTAHLTAQVLTPKVSTHNWQTEQMHWDLAKGRRDDWLMALVYATAAAVLKRQIDRPLVHQRPCLTVGVDVQAPAHNPLCYIAAVVFTAAAGSAPDGPPRRLIAPTLGGGPGGGLGGGFGGGPGRGRPPRLLGG